MPLLLKLENKRESERERERGTDRENGEINRHGENTAIGTQLDQHMKKYGTSKSNFWMAHAVEKVAGCMFTVQVTKFMMYN